MVSPLGKWFFFSGKKNGIIVIIFTSMIHLQSFCTWLSHRVNLREVDCHFCCHCIGNRICQTSKMFFFFFNGLFDFLSYNYLTLCVSKSLHVRSIGSLFSNDNNSAVMKVTTMVIIWNVMSR